MSGPTNLDIVGGMYAAFARGDLEAFLAPLADDVEWRFADSFVYGQVNPLIGKEALRSGSLRRLHDEWDDFRSPLHELIDAGDVIIGLGRYTGRHRATGRTLDAQFAHLFDLAGGQVVRWRQYVDTRQFAHAVGEDVTRGTSGSALQWSAPHP